MKIVYLAHVRMPTEKAHGTQIMEMCAAFAKAGEQVELVLPLFGSFDIDLFEYYGVPKTFTIRRVRVPSLIRLGPIGFLLQASIFLVGVMRSGVLRHADYIFSRDEFLSLIVSYVFRRVPLIWEVHDPARGIFGRFLWKRVFMVVGISTGVIEALTEKFGPRKRFVVAHDGVNLSQFSIDVTKAQARATLSLPANAQLALYAGHLYEWKGAHTFARAASHFPASVSAVFVGGTDFDIENFKKEFGEQKNIAILGAKKHSAIPLYLRAADVLVLPNSAKEEISRRFTSPLKLFEYMASGTPIIASDLPSLREVLNRQTALFFEPDNPSSLSDRIQETLKDSSAALARARAAQERVQAYTWDKRVQAILGAVTASTPKDSSEFE